MASEAHGMIQDQNYSFHYGASIGGKNNNSKAATRKAHGGRKPLGDLSNSVKAAINQKISRKPGPVVFDGNAPAVPRNASALEKKQSVSGVLEKGRANGRKALTDISNSEKQNAARDSKKKLKEKPSVLTHFSIHPDAIAEEGFLHDHRQCLEAQMKEKDIDEYLQILGLKSATLQLDSISSSPVHATRKIPAKSSLHLPKMVESWLPEEEASTFSPAKSSTCNTPRAAEHDFIYFTGDERINFKLVETPGPSPKHH